MRKLLIVAGVLIGSGLLLLTGLFVLVVWPTPFHTQQTTVNGKPATVRVDRISGQPERLTERGWVKMGSQPAAPSPVPTCAEAQAAYLRHGSNADLFLGRPKEACDFTEVRLIRECKQYREMAASNPTLLRIKESPLGCDVSDLIATYDRQRRY